MTARLSHRLAADNRGAAAVEFALVLPLLLIGMMGVFDLGYNMYTASILQGGIQKAARDSTIEGVSHAAIDARVTEVVNDIAPNAAPPTFKRTAYTNFTGVARPEVFDDLNSNGVCDDSEPYEDANGNKNWDTDRGVAGVGAARDAVLYEVTVVYPRPFPVAKLIGQSGYFTMKALTVLRNQPYGGTAAEAKMEGCV